MKVKWTVVNFLVFFLVVVFILWGLSYTNFTAEATKIGGVNPIGGDTGDGGAESEGTEVEEVPDDIGDGEDGTGIIDDPVNEIGIDSTCSSKWKCPKKWGACEGGVQERRCRDLNKCPVPTDVPETSRVCVEKCVESWECQWSSCKESFIIPENCVDKNNCGTFDELPVKMGCESLIECIPEVECNSWTDCEPDYALSNLVGKEGFAELGGVRSRLCTDVNSCVGSKREVQSCFVDVEVYSEEIEKCGGEKFVGIYNEAGGELVARLEMGTKNSPKFNLDLSGTEDIYCGYCSNGKLDGDETGIDCGGSCKSCEEKYPVSGSPVEDKGFFERVFGLFSR